MNKQLSGLIAAAFILLTALLILLSFFSSKFQENNGANTSVLVTPFIVQRDSSTTKRNQTVDSKSLTSEQKNSIFERAAKMSTATLTAQQQSALSSIQKNLPVSNDSFSIDYDQTIGKLVITKKKPSTEPELLKYLNNNGLYGLYKDARDIFIVTNQPFQEAVSNEKNEIIEAEGISNNTDLEQDMTPTTNITPSRSNDPSTDAHFTALMGLLKVFTTVNLNTPTTSSPLVLPLTTGTPNPITPNNNTVPLLWESARPEGAQWSRYLYTAIDQFGRNLLSSNPTDIAEFCPSYPSLTTAQKANFYALLISAIAKYESGFNPNSSYKESWGVYSNGLLQLSLGDGHGCNFQNNAETFDPKKNLECGVKILNDEVKRDNVIAQGSGNSSRGGARYWAVLRGSRSTRNNIATITKSSSICN